MHPVLTIMLLVSTSCLAHYRGYESRNLIEGDETGESDGTVLVECPVCQPHESGIPTREVCDTQKGNKMYKTCHRGTYVNNVCGYRLDCYRGPGEHCTEKMSENYYNQKCARGFYCDDTMHQCIGLGYIPDSRPRFYLGKMKSGYYGQAKKNELPESFPMIFT